MLSFLWILFHICLCSFGRPPPSKMKALSSQSAFSLRSFCSQSTLFSPLSVLSISVSVWGRADSWTFTNPGFALGRERTRRLRVPFRWVVDIVWRRREQRDCWRFCRGVCRIWWVFGIDRVCRVGVRGQQSRKRMYALKINWYRHITYIYRHRRKLFLEAEFINSPAPLITINIIYISVKNIYFMNNRNIEFLNLSFPKYYGRPDTLIDIKYHRILSSDSSPGSTIDPSSKLKTPS